MPRLLFYTLLFLYIPVHAQVYKGTIDKYPIVFEIIQEEEAHWSQARYYYTKIKSDIFLNRDEENAQVYSSNRNEPQEAEIFTLKKQGKKLSGTWTFKGKKLPVTLTEADTAAIKNDHGSAALKELRKDDLYGYLKLEDLKFAKTKEEKWDATTTLQWYREEVSQIEFFRIQSSTHLKHPEKINQVLREKHLEEVSDFIRCNDGAPAPGEYTFTAKLRYLSASLLSVSYEVSDYCYGARPYLSLGSLTADCKSLKILTLQDVFSFKDDDASEETWHALVKKYLPEELADRNNDPDCGYETADTWNMQNWVLTKTGLYIGGHPNSDPRCGMDDNWPIIPYKNLLKYRVEKERYVLE